MANPMATVTVQDAPLARTRRLRGLAASPDAQPASLADSEPARPMHATAVRSRHATCISPPATSARDTPSQQRKAFR